MNTIELTSGSQQLFVKLFADRGNWNGTPLFDGSKEDRGYLTACKKAGLLRTVLEEGCLWVEFTEAGVEFARSLGLKVSA